MPSSAIARIDWPAAHVPETRAWLVAGSTLNVTPASARPAPAKYVVLSSTSQVTVPPTPTARIDCPAGQVLPMRDCTIAVSTSNCVPVRLSPEPAVYVVPGGPTSSISQVTVPSRPIERID